MITAHLRKRRPKPHAICILTKSICKSMGGWFIYGAPSTPRAKFSKVLVQSERDPMPR
jgi:hypothetical protein